VHTEVRPARVDDLAALRWLEDEARADVATRRGGLRLLEERPEVGERWLQVVASGHHRVFVGAIDDVVIAYLLLGPLLSGGIAVVEQVYVSPGAREIGFGDDLLAMAIDAARAAGAVAIEAEALPGDRDTKNLYERAGVTARKIIVAKPLT
jgi:GNAT superfamily N-acetyltransferase